MKKILVLMLMLFAANTVFAQEEAVKPWYKTVPSTTESNKPRSAKAIEFERRLGLTEAQKKQIQELRFEAYMELQPIMAEIISKKQEAEMVKKSRIAVQLQEERLAIIDNELKILHKKANKIRKNNMKSFESVLTKGQKKILKQMKQEGRKKYHSNHPPK